MQGMSGRGVGECDGWGRGGGEGAVAGRRGGRVWETARVVGAGKTAVGAGWQSARRERDREVVGMSSAEVVCTV